MRVAAFALFFFLCACKPAEESHSKAILGAVLIDGRGGPPLTDSVVVVAGGIIRAAGARSTIPIPAEADKINGAGKFLVPALIDANRRRVPARPGDKVIYVWDPPEAAEAAIEAARARGMAAIAHASTAAQLRQLVEAGASGFIGMIPDTEPLEPALVSQLRNLRIFFGPVLGKSAAAHNTELLFRAGVPIVLATEGGDLQREVELLVDAGVPPLDAIVAGTRNSAAAVGEGDSVGTIEAGKRANLLLVSANPAEDVRNLRKVSLRMVDGEWVR